MVSQPESSDTVTMGGDNGCEGVCHEPGVRRGLQEAPDEEGFFQ